MPAYVLFRNDDIQWCQALIDYIRQVDATFESHGGVVLVQGFPARVVEGSWDGFVTLLQFPTEEDAVAWYDSEQYAAIRPLRQGAATSVGVVLRGVAEGYQSVQLLASEGSADA